MRVAFERTDIFVLFEKFHLHFCGYISALMFAFLLRDFKKFSIHDSMQRTCLRTVQQLHVSLQTRGLKLHRGPMWTYKVTRGPHYDTDATMAIPEPY